MPAYFKSSLTERFNSKNPISPDEKLVSLRPEINVQFLVQVCPEDRLRGGKATIEWVKGGGVPLVRLKVCFEALTI